MIITHKGPGRTRWENNCDHHPRKKKRNHSHKNRETFNFRANIFFVQRFVVPFASFLAPAPRRPLQNESSVPSVPDSYVQGYWVPAKANARNTKKLLKIQAWNLWRHSMKAPKNFSCIRVSDMEQSNQTGFIKLCLFPPTFSFFLRCRISPLSPIIGFPHIFFFIFRFCLYTCCERHFRISFPRQTSWNDGTVDSSIALRFLRFPFSQPNPSQGFRWSKFLFPRF